MLNIINITYNQHKRKKNPCKNLNYYNIKHCYVYIVIRLSINYFYFFVSGADYEPTVNEVKVPVLDRDLCNAWLKQKDVNITKGMICAGYEQGGKDACQVSMTTV